jgi:hypothetical protein
MNLSSISKNHNLNGYFGALPALIRDPNKIKTVRRTPVDGTRALANYGSANASIVGWLLRSFFLHKCQRVFSKDWKEKDKIKLVFCLDPFFFF